MVKQRNLPDLWAKARLGELVYRLVDGSHNPPQSTATGLPMLSARNVENGRITFDPCRLISEEDFQTEHTRTQISAGTVLLTIVGAIGRSAVVPDGMATFTLQRSVAAMKPIEISPEYLMYHFRSPDFQALLEREAKGTAQKGVYLGKLADQSLAVPPLNEQRRIARKIEALFERSRRARQALDAIPPLIEKLRQSILADAFRGDLTADWRAKNPDVEPAERLLQRIRAERRLRGEQAHLDKSKASGQAPKDDKWKECQEPEPVDSSDWPPLPPGWSWIAIDELAADVPRAIQSGPFGSNLKHSEFQSSGILVIGIDNVLDGVFSLGKQHRIKEAKFRELQKYTARPLDFLITVMATVGRCCIVPADIEPAIITKHVYRVTLDHELIDPYYMMFAMLGAHEIRRQLNEMSRGQTRLGINGAILRRIVVPVAPPDEQAEIVRVLRKTEKVIETQATRLKALSKQCELAEQAILAKAFRGELVSQDPNDEPASVLLERIRAARQDTPKRGKRARAPEPTDIAPAEPRPKARPEPQAATRAQPEPQAPARTSEQPEPESEPAQTSLPFGLAEQDPETVQHAVHAALWGRGPLEVDAAVRTVADALREQGLVQYKKLRVDGPLYADIKKAIDTAARAGWLDRPRRGHVRAVEPNPREYTTDDWRIALLGALDGEPVEREEAMSRAAEWARDNMGLEFKRLRTGGVIESGIKSAINSAIRRGELERLDATRIQRRT